MQASQPTVSALVNLMWPGPRLPQMLLLAVTLQVISLPIAQAQELPGLGIPLDATRANASSITVFPDGRGLPEGSGTAKEGAALYARLCAACHGPDGHDGPNDPLVGGQGTLSATRPKRTVGSYWPFPTTVFDYIRRSMPYYAPGSLSADEVYALTAYVLWVNQIIEESTRLSAQSLPDVPMPNTKGFDWTPH